MAPFLLSVLLFASPCLAESPPDALDESCEGMDEDELALDDVELGVPERVTEAPTSSSDGVMRAAFAGSSLALGVMLVGLVAFPREDE